MYGLALAFLALAGGAQAQGSVLLVGGGSEAPGAYAWFVDHAPSKRVVVLDYTSDPGTSITGRLADEGATVTYLAIASEAEANDPANRDAVLAADGVFLPGGDQWRYVSRWKGTLIEEALQTVFDRGGVLGGTSAGAAVLSEVVFDARRGSVSSREALLVPTTPDLSLTDDFLSVLPGTLADTHFDERGRLGRLLAMLARYHADEGRWVTGIGLSYGTALAVTPDGVGEVLGGGAVTLLYPTDRTEATVEPAHSLSLSDVRLVQLTEGYRVEVSNGTVVGGPGTGESYAAVPFEAPAFPLVLDGSGDADAWLAAGGSVGQLQSRLPPDALVCVVSRPDAAPASAVASAMADSGQPVLAVGLDAGSQGDAGLADAVRDCEAQVWVANDLSEIAALADAGTAVGAALRGRLAAGVPALMLGTDARAVGQVSILNTESRCDASYRGALDLAPGLNLTGGLVVMPLAFDVDRCHWENQVTGLAWGLAQSRASYGVLLGDGSTLAVEGSTVTMEGAMPTLVLDARSVDLVDYPARRNNPALVGAFVHVVADGESFDFASAPTASEPGAEGATTGDLLVHPNPTTGRAALRFDVGTGGAAALALYDLVGREVLRRDLGVLAAGEARVTLDLRGLPASLYVVRVRVGAAVWHQRVTLGAR
ncbi:cyanophycinase [Rubrivirga marina]|uniref:cyanophycinase n=1 Tax=Rubrivirga marina TaxID=1196024 RepID=UPI0015C8A9C1|nr:cyanophycinase [Rubrivirga marina]